MNWTRGRLLFLLGTIWAWVGCADVTSGPNQPPVASAGADRGANVDQVVRLNGSGSYDPDGDQLSFRWMLLSGPEEQVQELGSDVTLDFQPKSVGPWLVGLVVNDGKLDSEQDVVLVRTYDCDDKDDCTAHEYTDGIGCTSTRVQPGTPCGTCRRCDAAGECREDLTLNQDCQKCQVCAAGGQCMPEPLGSDLKKACADPLFCNGLEKCDGKGACQLNGLAPCQVGRICDEVNDSCGCLVDSECPLCQWCSSGICVNQQPGEDKKHECDDGLFCTQVDACDGAGACTHSGNPCSNGVICRQTCNDDVDNCFDPVGTGCDDGSFCNGSDMCDGVGNCSTHTGDPCANGGACNNYCVENPPGCYSPNGFACPDSTYCDGVEMCNGQGACLEIAQDPCVANGLTCDEGQQACVGCISSAQCPPCQYCDPGSQNCVNQDIGQDIKEDCPVLACHTGVCDGQGACGHLAIGEGCDGGDGNLCNSTCDAFGGNCRNGTPRDCRDSFECTQDACAPATGICSHTNLPQGTPCAGSNNSYCDSTCDNSGRCDDSTGVECLDDNDVCTVAVCNTATGLCTTSNAAPGTPCPGTDGNFCNHTCANGVCVDVPVVCEQLECHTSACQADGSCKEDHVASGTGCMGTDADWCNSTCNGSGLCIDTSVDCDDHNPCTTDPCDTNNGTCSHSNRADGAFCDSGGVDYCSHTCLAPSVEQPSTCSGPAVACNDFKDCTDDSCNLADGACRYTEKAPGTPCDDAQSNIDRCQHTCVAGGNCTGPAVSCSDYPGCSSPVCDPGNGKCSYTLFPVGTPCAGSDSEPCNSSCTSSGSCDDALPAADDQPCQDAGGNIGTCCSQACRVNWQCCTASACDDFNVCTEDNCSSSGTCDNTCGTSVDCMSLSVDSPVIVSTPGDVTINMCPGVNRDVSQLVCDSDRNGGSVLLREDFEVGFGVFAPSDTNNITRQAQAARTGAFGVRICNSNRVLMAAVNTPANNAVGLRFSIANANNSLLNNQILVAGYSIDGGTTRRSLILIGDNLNQSYQDYFFVLPSEASGATLTIMFWTNGQPNANQCGYIDDVAVIAMPSWIERSGMFAATFAGNSFSPFTLYPAGSADANLVDDPTPNRAVEIRHNTGTNIDSGDLATTGVQPDEYLVVTWDWKMFGTLANAQYVFLEYSLDGGSTWTQLSALGQSTSMAQYLTFSAIIVPCQSIGISNFRIRFIAPASSNNNTSMGAYVDNVYVRGMEPNRIDSFAPFVDSGDGVYTSGVTPSAAGDFNVRCYYGCGSARQWSNSVLVTATNP